jgi:hypothetical protein
MARIEKTVFISYRRTDLYAALAVYQDLTSRGYDVFLDYTSIHVDIEEIIVSNIRARAHFVLILTPTALDRSNEPDDWLKREIEIAIDEKRNIVPLFFDSFSFNSPSVTEKLTGKLAKIKRYNGLDIPSGFFKEAMDRLSNNFLSDPTDAVIYPVSNKVQQVVREEKSAANKVISGDREYLKRKKVKVPLVDSILKQIISFFNYRITAPPLIEPINTPVDGGVLVSKQVFISYSRHDVDFANRVNQYLIQNKISTWIDTLGIRSGEDWPDRVADAILDSRIVLIVISPSALESKWVKRELSFADQNEKMVFPVIYKNCTFPPWFNLRFGNIQWANFTSGEYNANMNGLLDSLKKILSGK